ncbi:unnamed protein product [Caenorhabditis bovis]|uniref:Uncharacterized protein n=1 Tax=Caenorhabditis bovis TaxID=2654633 RepID=A0A8S1FEH2_9PELO|nr:unnamed protein product [Caenorhabditis bovis]
MSSNRVYHTNTEVWIKCRKVCRVCEGPLLAPLENKRNIYAVRCDGCQNLVHHECSLILAQEVKLYKTIHCRDCQQTKGPSVRHIRQLKRRAENSGIMKDPSAKKAKTHTKSSVEMDSEWEATDSNYTSTGFPITVFNNILKNSPSTSSSFYYIERQDINENMMDLY